ncbi:MAG: endonuclease domain-containing protein [Candidatus Rokuibacteriota bacterium]
MSLALYIPSPLRGEGRVRGPMLQTAKRYSPSPLWGEGGVRGRTPIGAVCESPRDYARGLRRRQTDAERHLWARLRDRRLLGAKFARQVPIGPYVVDFCCREMKVIVELDGGQHAVQTRSDAERTALLEALGYRVLRFWNNDALGSTDGVLQRVAEALTARPSPRPSPRRGEGEGWEPSPPQGERVG